MQFEELGKLFVPDLKGTPEAAHCGVADEDIFRRMQEHSQGDLILEEGNRPYSSEFPPPGSSTDVPEGTSS